MAQLTHAHLVKLGQELGYPLRPGGGLCHGFSSMLCQAWLLNDARAFIARLRLIEAYRGDFKRLKKEITHARQDAKGKAYDTLDKQTKLLLEIPAFYEGIELYLCPDEHTDLFSSHAVYQGDLTAIYSVARAKQLEQDDLSQVLNKPYAFDKCHLIDFLNDLQRILKSVNSTAPILLSSANHSVCLRYNVQRRTWEYSDINDFAMYDASSYSVELDSHSLAECIFRSFRCNDYAVFNTKILSKSDQQHAYINPLDKLNKKYPITPEQGILYDDEQVGMLYVASQNGNLDAVCEVLKYLPDINHTTRSGDTALVIACQNGHAAIVHKLLSVPGIDVDYVTASGDTALDVARQFKHLEIVDELLKYSVTAKATRGFFGLRS